MGRPAGLEARAGKRDQRSFPMNASARTEMEAEARSLPVSTSSVHFSLDVNERLVTNYDDASKRPKAGH
jgi:hypothetical protein